MNRHNPQKINDEIVILNRGDQVIACGYICSKCKQSVFPMGSHLPDELLTNEEIKILNCECTPEGS